GSSTTLIEELKPIFKHCDIANTLKDQDSSDIIRMLKALYKGPIKDGEEILDSVINFASYIVVKDIVDKFDIKDYHKYSSVVTRIKSAVNKEMELGDKTGIFLVSGVRSRVIRRKLNPSVLPTPFYQVNASTNAGGYPKHSVIVLMDKQKGGK